MDRTPRLTIHIVAVHRLSRIGAVVTHITRGTSQNGFEAEWHDVNLLTLHDGLIDRSERYNEADLEAALERFDELQTNTGLLRNAATEQLKCFRDRFCARDWDAIAETVALDFTIDDRRLAVNSGSSEAEVR
jgi:hypothetical protein